MLPPLKTHCCVHCKFFSLVDIYLFRENGDGLGGDTPSTLSLNWRGVGGITEFVLSSCQLPR